MVMGKGMMFHVVVTLDILSRFLVYIVLSLFLALEQKEVHIDIEIVGCNV